jgi:hypothetical protein
VGVVEDAEEANHEAKEDDGGGDGSEADASGADGLEFEFLGHAPEDEENGDEGAPGEGEGEGLRNEENDQLQKGEEGNIIIDEEFENALEGVAEDEESGEHGYGNDGDADDLPKDVAIKNSHEEAKQSCLLG